MATRFPPYPAFPICRFPTTVVGLTNYSIVPLRSVNTNIKEEGGQEAGQEASPTLAGSSGVQLAHERTRMAWLDAACPA